VLFGFFLAIGIGAPLAHALDAVSISPDADAINLTPAVELRHQNGDQIQVSTAPDPQGIVRRIEVHAREPGSSPTWAIFALSNSSDEQIDRLLIAPHFKLAGSGLFRPDLGGVRIVTITPSQGFRPESEKSTDADIFLITLDPGATVTFVAELKESTLPELTLWKPNAYKDKLNNLTLFRGIVIGISGLAALFLTILFLVKGTAMFPAAASFAWAVLAYLCIDFGFWPKVFGIHPDSGAIYRAGAEAVIAATLLIFLFAYLNLNRWHTRFNWIALAWLAGLIILIGVSVIDAPLAAGIARISSAFTAVCGLILIVWLSLQGYDRAVMLIPTWLLLLLWLIAASFTAMGYLKSDLISAALGGGLVLIVLLVGFTIMQHAFAGGTIQGLVSDNERRALALVGSGDIVWDWDVARDRVHMSANGEQALGWARGTMEGPALRWLDFVHPSDRDRLRTIFDALLDQRRGRLKEEFRLRNYEGHFRWFLLRARPVVGSDGEVLRCVGTLIDVTDSKTAEERLLHDAVHDNLTGLPNRELFIDRLDAALKQAQAGDDKRPTIFVIDLDRFKLVNESVGMNVGDSILMTLARRLTRLLKGSDTLARLQGDQFALLLVSESAPERIAAFAEQVRKIIRSPLAFGGRELFLTASLGLAVYDKQYRFNDDILKDAELAMYHAKKLGGDRIEAFKPQMRTGENYRLVLESDLRLALERKQIKVVYQPIVHLGDNRIAGFEALARWEHPRREKISTSEFISMAEEIGIIQDLGLYVLDEAAKTLSVWQKEFVSDPPLFVSVNISSRQLMRHDLINEVKTVLQRHEIIANSLHLELTESLIMENPEFSTQVLSRIRELGAGLALDDFGTGYSSLAQLQRFAFDMLKIDRSLVRPDKSGRRPVILRSIIAMARDLGIEVVAEGAETSSDGLELLQLGCHYAQGFAYGEPMAMEKATEILQRIHPRPARG
jgi:diguanylate cyclase (GGDEF)-like protein/PAS domain S-box-containing protein